MFMDRKIVVSTEEYGRLKNAGSGFAIESLVFTQKFPGRFDIVKRKRCRPISAHVTIVAGHAVGSRKTRVRIEKR